MTQSTLQTEESETLNESASATDTGETLEENTTVDSSGDESENVSEQSTDEQANEPSGFTKRIHQKHHELMEEKRAREAAEAELARIKASSEQQRPVIPELPDPYDDNFDQLIAARDKAVQEAAIFDANQRQSQAQRESTEQQRIAEQQQQLVTAVKTYADRAATLNISPEALQVAGQTVAAYGIDDQLASYILGDEQGPLITTYLAQNPAELEKISGFSPMQAAVYLETNIKPKAGSVKRNSSAPPPADTLSGGGAPPKERGPKGAKYE